MTLAQGDRIGSYEVICLLDAGGQGEVYRARDSQLSRDVALKVLRDDRLDGKQRARFEREAQTLAALNHPNIATILGIEDRDGLRAIVMEFVRASRWPPCSRGMPARTASERGASHRGADRHRARGRA